MTELGEFGFMENTPENLEWVRRLFMDPTKQLVFHNAKFDLKMFWFSGIDIFNMKARAHCTLILSKLFNENGNHDLRGLGIRYLKRDTEAKDEIAEWVKKHNTKRLIAERGRRANFSDAPRETVKRRALWDVETTLLLYCFLYHRVMETCPQLYENERQLQFVVIDMENHGVVIDITHAKRLRAAALRGMERIQKHLDYLCCPLTITRKKKGVEVEEELYEFNANSSQIQLPAAFRKLGIPLKYKTKPKKKGKNGAKVGGGNWAFDEASMMKYVSPVLGAVIRDSSEEGWSADKFYRKVRQTIKKHKLNEREWLPPLVLKYREVSKMVSTYYNHLIEDSVDGWTGPDGREYAIIHCKFNQSEALTGRFSSSQPNLQNMPRKLGPRECFVTRRGRRNWFLDYSQVEMKFFVHFAKDDKMAAAIDDDIHRAVASEIYSMPVGDISKEQRKRAKAINFGILYGSGAATAAETLTERGLPTTALEASMLVQSYHLRFPSVRETTNDFKADIARQGYVENPFGRRYHIPLRFAYKALNYMCQGTSADQIKFAMVKIWKWLRKKGLKTRLIKTIHDEIVLEIPPCEEEVVVPKAMAMMNDLTSYYVPITVEAEVATHRWSKKVDAKEAGYKFVA